MKKNNQIDILIDNYEDLIEPSNFVRTFDSLDEFRKWCELGTVRDLECTLDAFEQSEEYEYCSIILETLKKKQNEC